MVHKYSELDLMQARIKEVPKGWSFLPIVKAFKIRNELRKPISDEIRCTQQGIYPYYGPTKIQDYIDTYEQDGSFALIGEDGDHFLKYKSQSMTQLVDGKCTVNNHAHIIEGTKTASREWFCYYFMHRDIFSYLSRQGAGRYKLNKASLEKIYLLIPPSEEQDKIVKILATWDQAISTTEKLLKNSQQQKKALMQRLLTGEKRLLDENGKVFNSEWLIFSVNQIGRVVTGSTPPKEQVENYGNCFNWATAEDFQGKYIDDTKLQLSEIGVRKARILSKGAVLVTCIASIGKNAIANKEMATNQQINAVEVNEFNSNEFFYYLIEFNVKKLRALAGTTAVAILNKSTFEKIKFNMPSLQEQRKIAQVISVADQEIEILQKKLDCFKEEKKALMQQLLTGKKRVKEAA
ncbi:restriction endonuclease subunit S [Acinetobacter sp. V89_4]|uniref:restriction endonuclease subunit S n=1 Tax=Acinetobacter sp. V89_4 TaxID=3044232 RepID=UPI00249F2BF1|nr:restriction endonuclease subunit S [Acinetobacter sp. V89_4]MDI3451681.1 restriction endonuclease subunit S [Acinetobacter sp. V89_4]